MVIPRCFYSNVLVNYEIFIVFFPSRFVINDNNRKYPLDIMDLEWITTADRDSVEYFRGVTALVAAATSTNSVDAPEYIWCPCHDYKKDRLLPAQRVHSHLLTTGFMDNFLGEEEQDEGSANNCHGHDADVGYDEEEDQTCVDHGEPNLDHMLRDGERFDTDHKFTTMVKDSKTPIYNGCKAEHSKLQVVLSLLHLKASNGLSDKSFTELLELMKEILATDNVLPESTYQAKKVICPLGLDIQKIHACLNDCILYRGEFADLEQCPVCKASRYKCGDGDDEGGNKKRVPVKVVWYFPIIPVWNVCMQTKSMPS